MSSAARISLPRQPWQHALARLADERGAIAIEYGLIAALIALAIIGTLFEVGEAVLALPMQSLIDAFEAVIS